MERSKPAAPAAPEQDAKPSSPSTASDKKWNASSEQRVRDLERRLDALDSGEKNTTDAMTVTDTRTGDAANSAIPARESNASSTTATPSPNPLLVRIHNTMLSVTDDDIVAMLSLSRFMLCCWHPSLIIQQYIETNPGRPRTCTARGAEGKGSQKSCGR